mgnify:CR=1 FL=1
MGALACKHQATVCSPQLQFPACQLKVTVAALLIAVLELHFAVLEAQFVNPGKCNGLAAYTCMSKDNDIKGDCSYRYLITTQGSYVFKCVMAQAPAHVLLGSAAAGRSRQSDYMLHGQATVSSWPHAAPNFVCASTLAQHQFPLQCSISFQGASISVQYISIYHVAETVPRRAAWPWAIAACPCVHCCRPAANQPSTSWA